MNFHTMFSLYLLRLDFVQEIDMMALGLFVDIRIEHCKFVKKKKKKYDKPYNGLMFMGQNFTRNPFMTSK